MTMTSPCKLDDPRILPFIFSPQQSPVTPLPVGAQDVNIEVEPGVIIGCRLYLDNPESPNILYFHGNGEKVSDHDEIGPMYNQVGLNLLVTEYRGYGWSNGTPTVQAMFADAETLFHELGAWLTFNHYSGPLFVMGRSLGSACAIDLAARHKNTIKGLIIESGFGDTLPLAASLGIQTNDIELTEAECFNNISKIAQVTKPTYILHGARDQLIPVNEAENLQSYCGARTKEFQIIPGADHNSTISSAGPFYFRAIKQFIDKVTGATNWRNRRRKSKETQ